MQNKDLFEAEAKYVAAALKDGRAEELLDHIDHPSSEGVVEVALEALTAPNGDVTAALSAIREYVRG